MLLISDIMFIDLINYFLCLLIKQREPKSSYSSNFNGGKKLCNASHITWFCYYIFLITSALGVTILLVLFLLFSSSLIRDSFRPLHCVGPSRQSVSNGTKAQILLIVLDPVIFPQGNIVFLCLTFFLSIHLSAISVCVFQEDIPISQ